MQVDLTLSISIAVHISASTIYHAILYRLKGLQHQRPDSYAWGTCRGERAPRTKNNACQQERQKSTAGPLALHQQVLERRLGEILCWRPPTTGRADFSNDAKDP